MQQLSGTRTYDGSGNLLESVDPRGSTGTVWMDYDGLNRPVWRNTTNGSGAYASYTYDTAPNGKGRLASESFNPSATLGKGSYSYTYDARGQTTAETEALDGSTYSFSMGYNDAGQPTSVTYSDGEVFALSYNDMGWLSSASTTPSGGGAQVTLATSLSYSGNAGAAETPTGASVGNGTYSYSASYDADLRLSSASLSLAAGGTTLYSTARGYDAVGNVTSVQTTLAAGTDNQTFCYDEQNRLTWASSQSAMGPCGAANTAGTLTAQAAQYTSSCSYDALNRLTRAPLGTYTYGGTQLHAASAVGSSYTASYDAAGDMTCHAPSSGITCAGSSPNGEQLGYDNERRLVSWQSAASLGPVTTASYAYDGEGHRVAQSVTPPGGSTTTTDYLAGGLEEASTSNGTSTLTRYESVPGVTNVVISGSGPSESVTYVATDGLGSVSEALSSSGTVTAQQLYGPYGAGRYSSGSMPTAKGFTGQYADAASSGLDYYGARYYDPAIGQFTSADTAGDGLNRYAYVGGNPETATDPTGQRRDCQQFDDCSGGGSGTSDRSGAPGRSGCGDTCSCHYGCGHGGGGGGSGGSGCGHRCDPSCTGVSTKCPPPPVPAPTPNPTPTAHQGSGNTSGTAPDCATRGCAHSGPPPCSYSAPGRLCSGGDDHDGLWSLISEYFGGSDPDHVVVRLPDVEWFLGVLSQLQKAGDSMLGVVRDVLGGIFAVAGIFTFTPCSLACGTVAGGAATGVASFQVRIAEFDSMIAHVSRELDAATTVNWGTKADNVYFVLGETGGSEWYQQYMSVDTYIAS